MVDVRPRGSLIKKTAEVVVLRGRRRRRDHCKKGSTLPRPGSLPPPPAPSEAPARLPFITRQLIRYRIPRLAHFPRVEQQHLFNSSMDQQDSPIPVASSSNGRVSGKPWKTRKTPTAYVLHPVSTSVKSQPGIFQSVAPAAGFKIEGLPR